MRRAGSPQQLSSAPNMPKLIPAALKIFTIETLTLVFRSSSAPVHPTQYSKSRLLSSARVLTPNPSAQDVRVDVVPRHGWSRVLKLLRASCADAGTIVLSM